MCTKVYEDNMLVFTLSRWWTEIFFSAAVYSILHFSDSDILNSHLNITRTLYVFYAREHVVTP